MKMLDTQLLESWLNLVCKMIQGSDRAVIELEDDKGELHQIAWPRGPAQSPLVDAAARARSTQKPVVLPASNEASGNNNALMIAIPLKNAGSTKASIAVSANVPSSQQAVVIQLLNWGDRWLGLLQQATASPATPERNRRSLGLAKTQPGASNWFQRLRVRLVWPVLLLLAVAGLLLDGTHRVSSQALLEGGVQRAVVAPFDGYISQAHKQAGDIVSRNELLAEMDADELQLRRRKFESEKSEHNRLYRQALGQRDMAQAFVHKTQIEQADTQLDMVQRQVDQSQIRAPIDGYILSGDLSRSLGAPVKLGDLLFEVAPIDDLRLVIHVDEKDIAHIHRGARGEVTLRGLPDESVEFEVKRISPVFEANLDSVAFRVEASIDQHDSAMRPGMQGVARIEAGQRTFAWILLHELVDASKLWLWQWMP